MSANGCASGTAELGSCLTDATREGRSRRAVVNLPLRLRPNVSPAIIAAFLTRWYHTNLRASLRINKLKLGWLLRAVKVAERAATTFPVRYDYRSGHQLIALKCPLIRHPLSEAWPVLTASTTMRMAWMTVGALSIMMLCPECVSVM